MHETLEVPTTGREFPTHATPARHEGAPDGTCRPIPCERPGAAGRSAWCVGVGDREGRPACTVWRMGSGLNTTWWRDDDCALGSKLWFGNWRSVALAVLARRLALPSPSYPNPASRVLALSAFSVYGETVLSPQIRLCLAGAVSAHRDPACGDTGDVPLETELRFSHEPVSEEVNGPTDRPAREKDREAQARGGATEGDDYPPLPNLGGRRNETHTPAQSPSDLVEDKAPRIELAHACAAARSNVNRHPWALSLPSANQSPPGVRPVLPRTPQACPGQI